MLLAKLEGKYKLIGFLFFAADGPTMCGPMLIFFVPCDNVETFQLPILSSADRFMLFTRRFLPWVGYVTIAMVRTSRLPLKVISLPRHTYFDVCDIHIPRTISLHSNMHCSVYWG